jgi:peptide/nickel transport system ATP-binding protein
MREEQHMATEDILVIEDLQTEFTFDDGVVKAVNGVSIRIPAGKTVCVVGESGCGKSVTARSVLQLVERPGKIAGGHIWWKGSEQIAAGSRASGRRNRPSTDDEGRTDILSLDPAGERMRQIRGGEIAMIFQEPMASLSPMYTIGNHLIEAITLHRPMPKEAAETRAKELLAQVGIPRPEKTMESYSFQLSGGMCQRVMIAMALSCEPKLLIADEPTTALDVTTQARILDLLRDLQEETGMSIMFITHDLGVVAELADEVVVMYLGTVVERAPVFDLFANPQHPYTRALLGSIPQMGAGSRQELKTIVGQVPHPFSYPSGCPFHPRCTEAIAGVCNTVVPPTVAVTPTHTSKCVLHDPELVASVQASSPGAAGDAA